MRRRPLGHGAPRHHARPDCEKPVSVVVLTHQRAAELARTLRHLCALPEQPPVIVVDNDSQDDTVAMVRQDFPSVALVRAPRNLGASGRNLGAARVRTPYVAFCDDDTWWGAGSLALAAGLLDHYPHIGALTARVLVGPEQREDPACRQMSASPLRSIVPLPGPPILGLLAGASVFRTGAFLAAGGYHPRFFLGGEETVLAFDLASAGWSLGYAPQLTVFHYPSPLRDAKRRRSLLARNAVWTAWLRLPVSSAIACTFRCAPQIWRDAGGIGGCWETMRGLRWILPQRRVLPPPLDAMRRRLQRWESEQQESHRARNTTATVR